MKTMYQHLAVLAAVLAVAATLPAQTNDPQLQVPKVVPVPPLHRSAPVPDPADPPPQDVTDARDHLTFHLPAAWNLSRKDGEISSFHADARTAPRQSQLRMVASLAFNPYPQSTFAGALFYISSTPNISLAACAFQTAQKPFTPLPPATVDDVKFTRGKDEHGVICTEARDVAYTAVRNGSCLRFDLAINSFCGGDVSGAQDLSPAQLGALYKRLEDILNSVHFIR